MDKNILVSVVIPVYKTEKFLENAVNSVVKQTYSRIEIILVDDGSPDICPQLCDELAEKYENIFVLHKENGGLSSARNAGLECVKGKYVYFLDSDDTIEEHAIEDMVRIAEKENSDVVFPNQYYKVYEDTNEKKLAFHYTEDIFETNPQDYALNILIGRVRGQRSTAVLYRTSVLVDNNVRFPVGLISEDFFFMLDLMVVAKKLSIYTKPSLFNLKRIGSITGAYHPEFEKTIWLMDEKAKAFIKKIGREDKDAMQKVDDLLCRNTIAYLFKIMSSLNPAPYKEKKKVALDLLYHEKTRKVWKKNHPAPYFKSKKTKLAFTLVYKLLRYNFVSLALRFMSFS
ncbi:MAG: glycosyltransferase family 2 protein [Clostridia bacterium]|nr:glycosyltransferase family 2 protein [Clostridia bacterium]